MKKQLLIVGITIVLIVVGLSGCVEVHDNEPPSAKITANPIEGDAPLTVYFKGTGEDTDGKITTYEWDFGEGGVTSDEQNTSYTYIYDGVYSVSLTVFDNWAAMGSDFVTITVGTPEDGEVVNQKPVIEDMTCDQLHENYSDTPHKYLLTVCAIDYDENLPLRYVWSVDCGYFVGETNSSSVEWRYDTPGECIDAEVTVTVTDSLGASESFTKFVF